MARVGERIRVLRIKRGLSQSQLADDVGISRSRLGNYEQGIREPDYDTIELFADYFDVSVDDLMGRNDKTMLLQDNEATLIQTKRIPILGDTAAGVPIIANREYEEYIDVPMDGHRFDAAVRVTGDSMLPRYEIGDLALIRYQDDVEDGEIAVVCLDDTVTLKRLFHLKDGVMLQSDNHRYGPMILTTQEVPNIHLTGRAVGVIHWEK